MRLTSVADSGKVRPQTAMATHGGNVHISNSGVIRRESLRDMLIRFADKTTFEGVSLVHNTESFVGKVIWMCLSLICLGAVSFQLYSLISVYYSYPTQTTLQLGFSPLGFPAVTFCNVNPVRMSQLSSTDDEIRALVNHTSPQHTLDMMSRKMGNVSGGTDSAKTGSGTEEEKKEKMDYINDLDLGVTFNNMKHREDMMMQEEEKHDAEWGMAGKLKAREKMFSQHSVSASITQEFQILYSNLPIETQKMIGHQAEDMIVDCSFSGRRCFPQNFTHISSTLYGNCFTIDHSAMTVTASGAMGGLSLVLYLENHEYLPGVTTRSGVQVIVHPHNTMPFPHEDGVAVMSGTETNIGLRRINIHRADEPYGDCQTGKEFKDKYGYTYSRRACQMFCEHGAIINKCNCYSFLGGQNVRQAMKRNVRWCVHNAEYRCMLKVQGDFAAGIMRCPCQHPCYEQAFAKTISSLNWPTDEYKDVLVETVCMQKKDRNCNNYRTADNRFVAQSFVKINIFYEDLNYENITEVPNYEPSQFASDIGGTMGMWLGLSFLSLLQLPQLLGNIVLYFANSNTHDRKPSPRQNPSPKKQKEQGPTLEESETSTMVSASPTDSKVWDVEHSADLAVVASTSNQSLDGKYQ